MCTFCPAGDLKADCFVNPELVIFNQTISTEISRALWTHINLVMCRMLDQG